MNTTPSRPQIVRDELHARELVAAWRSDNVPLKTFCRRRNLSYASVYAWKRRLDCAVPALLEVRVAPATRAVTYDVVLAAGVTIRVPGDFDDTTLTRLVAAVVAAC